MKSRAAVWAFVLFSAADAAPAAGEAASAARAENDPRAASVGQRWEESRRYYYEDIFTPFFEKNEAAGIYESRRRGSTRSRFSIRKSTDAFRVFVVGGSIALKYMEGEGGLGPALSNALPSLKVEALNCGMGGYDSYREALVLDEVLGYSPDLILLLTGHNERLGSPPVPLWILHAQDRMARVEAFRRVVDGLPSWSPWHFEGDYGQAAERRDRSFEKNLREMILRAKDAGVPIAVAAPPLNWRDAPTQHPVEEPAFLAGWVSYLRSDYGAARERWEALVLENEKAPGASLPLFFLGRLAEKMERREEANRRYVEAMEADSLWNGRCAPPCQRAIRRAAAEEGAIWIDLDAAFRALSSHRLPGFDVFDSAVHWHHRHDGAASQAILAALRTHASLAVLPWRRRMRAIDETGMKPKRLSREEASVVLRYALSEMSPQSSIWRAAAHLAAVFEARPEWFGDIDGLARRADAGKEGLGSAWGQAPINPDPAILRWCVGRMHLERGDLSAASANIRLALRRGAPPRALLDLAIVHGLSGNADDSRKSLREAKEKGLGAQSAALWAELDY